jgi:hypothetical protein
MPFRGVKNAFSKPLVRVDIGAAIRKAEDCWTHTLRLFLTKAGGKARIPPSPAIQLPRPQTRKTRLYRHRTSGQTPSVTPVGLS